MDRPSTKHSCPGPTCQAQIPRHLLACRRHWAQVPYAVQRAVYATWQSGAGAGSTDHAEAMAAAIEAMRP